MDFANIGLAFIEGFALILSPCILPVLPIILSAGITGNRYRPYGIITGFIIAFCAFTLISRKLILLLNIDTEIFRTISFYILILFGLILISDYLSRKFSALTQRFANLGEKLSTPMNKNEHNGFFGGLLLGLPIGLVWTPCAGPIIAAVIVQTIRQQSNLDTFLILLSFSIGTGVPMLLLALQGNFMMRKMPFFKKHSETIRKIAGIIIIATVLFTAQGSLFKMPAMAETATTNQTPVLALENGLSQPYPAPSIQGIDAWINSPPLQIADLKGKVVLIDFWTYSCINCVRTLPYLIAWDAKYRSKGLVIIGIHSPEFPFEQKLSNVQAAVKADNIHYPVALDNNLSTWSNYNNQYWPAHYLIDKNGNVVYTHFGEGDYDITENNIRVLLGENPTKNTTENTVTTESETRYQTPETYLGTERGERFDELSANPPVNHWTLIGNWEKLPEKIVAQQAGSAIILHFYAQKVFLVLGTAQSQPIIIERYLNGKDIGSLKITADTLYQLVNLSKPEDGVLEIKTDSPGLEAYAFTFG